MPAAALVCDLDLVASLHQGRGLTCVVLFCPQETDSASDDENLEIVLSRDEQRERWESVGSCPESERLAS